MKTNVHAFLTGFVIFILAAAAMRTLASAFGNSAFGSLAVGFSISLGLVLGIYYFSARHEKSGAGSRVLGLLDLAAAICLLILITVLPAMHRAYAFIHSLGPTSPGALVVVRYVLTTAVLIVPSVLLGGAIALTVLARGSRAAGTVGAASLGLAVAVPVVTLVVLPGWGVTMALALGAIIAAALSGASMLMRVGSGRPEAGTGGAAGAIGVLISAGIFLVSFSAVSHTGLYMRVLQQVTGANAHTFVANALVMTLGIFIGCSVIANLLAAGRVRYFGAGLLAIAAALYALAVLGIVDTFPVRFLEWTEFGSNPGGFTNSYFYFAVITLFVPGLALGAVLGSISGAGPGAGLRRILVPAGAGAVLAYAIALPAVAGALGLETGLTFVAWVGLVGGAALLGGSEAGPRGRAIAILPGLVIAIVLTAIHPQWNRSALTSGVYVSPQAYANVSDVPRAIGTSDITFYEEDFEGIVTTFRSPDGTFLRLNGGVVGAAGERIGPDMLAAHIPMLLHENPENVLVLGLGSGATLGSVQRYEVAGVTVAEPVGAIVEAAPGFGPYTYNALEDRRTSVASMGPREFMRLTRDRYDVIISMPAPGSDPVHASALTVDFMLLARSVLAYDGVFCYVLDLSDLSRDCVMTTVSSFLTSFPYASAWYAGSMRVLLLGSMESLGISERAVEAKLERPWVSNDLKRLQISDATGVLANYMMGRDELRSYLGAFSGSNSDRKPCLACERVSAQASADIIETFSDLNRFSVNPIKAVTDYEEDSIEYKLARDRFDRCKEARDYYIGSYLALGSGNQQEASRRLEYAASLCSANGLVKERLCYFYIYVSRELSAAGRFDEAINVARRAVEVSPFNYLAFYNLALLERTRDPETAVALLERLLQLNPDFVPADIMRAELLLEVGLAGDASEVISEVLSREPLNRRAHHIRALCFVERGLTEAARVELEYVLDADPEDTEALAALGYTWLLVGDVGEAEKYYARAYELEPGNLGVINNYATVLAEKGEYRKAILIWQEGLKLDPTNAGLKANIQEATQRLSED